jgi:hypothetical protein
MRQIDVPQNQIFHPATAAKSERAEFIGIFTERLNAERHGTVYPPLSYAGVAALVSQIATRDLHAFLQDCRRGPSFGKVFFGALQPGD